MQVRPAFDCVIGLLVHHSPESQKTNKKKAKVAEPFVMETEETGSGVSFFNPIHNSASENPQELLKTLSFESINGAKTPETSAGARLLMTPLCFFR